MHITRFSLMLLLFIGLISNAQIIISGQIDLNDLNVADVKIHLTKLNLDHIGNLRYPKEIAWSPLTEDGSFSFDLKHVSTTDAIYKLYIERVDDAIKDTIVQSKPFILSKSDSIYFHKGHGNLENYISSSAADKEWQRLREFEQQFFQSPLNKSIETSEFTNYAKDSLRILMVKLIGVWQLEEKKLLALDIAKNPNYYLALLTDLKDSDIPAAQYIFLENRLAYLTQAYIEQKFAWSTAFNFILSFLVVGLGTLLLIRKKNHIEVYDLSRQERNVQALILEGKTNKEIANELFISLSTVKTHITNIYNKLKVANRHELIKRFQN